MMSGHAGVKRHQRFVIDAQSSRDDGGARGLPAPLNLLRNRSPLLANQLRQAVNAKRGITCFRSLSLDRELIYTVKHNGKNQGRISYFPHSLKSN